ncbi:MAG: hypothetical protein OHK0012_03900 [Synechococcales cyanobacterium]
MDPSEVEIKALQDKIRRLESSLLMTMGMVKTLHGSLHSSMTTIRTLETALTLSQKSLEQVLATSSLDPNELAVVLTLIQDSLQGLTTSQSKRNPAVASPLMAVHDDFSPNSGAFR